MKPSELSNKEADHLSTVEAWQDCLEIISKKVSPQSYKTWFEPISPLQLKDDEFTIQVPSQFFYEWIEENYYTLLKKTLMTVMGENVKLKYSIVVKENEIQPAAITVHDQTNPTENGINVRQNKLIKAEVSSKKQAFFSANVEKFETFLNPKYTFDNFIKGSCNDLAVAAARSVSEDPGMNAYNPLVIYGNVGLGKTHIVQAIGNYAREKKRANLIVYVSSEKFTIEMVSAIQNNRMESFSSFFRSLDLLIVDDIQFIAGKGKTQEEIFHVFNTLHQANKQVVLSCDRPIKDLKDIQDRLLSRFQWGLAADLQIPDYETRLAILYRKLDEIEITEAVIPDDVIAFIARNVDTNVRELEGCIIRLLASASLHRKDITLENSKEVLKDIIRKKQINISSQYIEKTVCNYYKISENDLKGKSRRQEIALARQICMYLMKTLTGSSLKTIGLHLGGRDHSTVIHACTMVEARYKDSPIVRKQIDEIKKQLEFEAD